MNEHVYNAFLCVSNQWRAIGGFGGVHWLGLDYAAVEFGLRQANYELGPSEWADFQVIEAAATAERNRKP